MTLFVVLVLDIMGADGLWTTGEEMDFTAQTKIIPIPVPSPKGIKTIPTPKFFGTAKELSATLA